MTDTSSRAGGRQPTNVIAGNEYRPIVGESSLYPTAFPPGLAVIQSDEVHTVLPGNAEEEDTASVIGLMAAVGVVGERTTLQTHGVLTLTTQEWDAVTDESGGLVRNSIYYLTALSQDGHITRTPPTTPGEFVVQVGIALSAIDMLVQIGPAQIVPGG